MRSLYQCLNAKVNDESIQCPVGKIDKNVRELARGAPLEMSGCQACLEYDDMGPPVKKSERGWVKNVRKL